MENVEATPKPEGVKKVYYYNFYHLIEKLAANSPLVGGAISEDCVKLCRLIWHIHYIRCYLKVTFVLVTNSPDMIRCYSAYQICWLV